MSDLDDAQRDENGAPMCGDEFCPGSHECTDCRDLRLQEWLRHETTDGANGEAL